MQTEATVSNRTLATNKYCIHAREVFVNWNLLCVRVAAEMFNQQRKFVMWGGPNRHSRLNGIDIECFAAVVDGPYLVFKVVDTSGKSFTS